MSVLGVDACKTGWVAVELDDNGVARAHYAESVASFLHLAPDVTVMGIDIPIGLPEVGRRRVDEAAKVLLGPRRSSVFLTPPREVLMASTHAEATALSVELSGLGISQQAFALRSRILEVDEWLPRAPCRVVEVHPEVCFATLLGRPATASKKTWAGMSERRRALEAAGIALDQLTGDAAVRANVDDMLDAAVAAWSVRRVRDGAARRVPAAAAWPNEPAIWA